jgi:hypothetical protein
MTEYTQELVKKHIRYENGNLYWIDFSIRPTAKTGPIGYKCKSGYVLIKFMKKTTTVHRIVFLYHHGYLPKCIDHINGNKSDNRIENLRDATHCQNMMNIGKSSLNKSGYKGVSFQKTSKKWIAQIKQNKNIFYLGLFDCPKKAYEVYCKKALELHGEFANIG